MSWYDARGTLEDTSDEVRVPIPTDGRSFEAVYRVEGLTTGTIQAQDQDGNGLDTVEAGATGTVSAADPTADGVYHCDPADSDTELVITATALSAGTPIIEVVLIPSET